MKRSNDSKVTVVNLGIRWKNPNYPSDVKVLGSSAFFLLTLLRWTSTALWLTCSCRPGGCFVETLRSFGSFLRWSLFRFLYKGPGPYIHFCPRPCSSTCRWARLATHRRRGPHFVCIPCSRATVLPRHVWRRQETGLSPVVRTCSMKWEVLRRFHNWEHRRLFDTVHVRKPRSKKLALTSHETFVTCKCCNTRFLPPLGTTCTGA